MSILGLHHITALCSDPQKNSDFYAGILGLRRVKKTINFDAPEIYHLYYGNETGSPGTILTFFPYPTLPKGRSGSGQQTVTSFSIPEQAINYWLKRLKKFNVPHQLPLERFKNELFIAFEDPDGLGLELVANSDEKRPGFTYGNIPIQFSIRGFYGITLSEEGYEKTAHLLTGPLDHRLIAQHENRFRYCVKNREYVDVICHPDALKSVGGVGTIHHVAFSTADDQTQILARDKLIEYGLNVTPVLDREYFHSVYFREPGGVLFEIATNSPGFAVDEEPAHLGEALKLPPWQERNRSLIEKILPPISLDIGRFADDS